MRIPVRRRRRLRTVALVVAAVLVVGATAAATFTGWQWATADIDTAGRVAFTNRLAVPPLAPSHLDERGRRVFDLEAAAGRHEFTPGRPARTWGLNGPYLGPTLRATRGESVVVNVHNRLPEATTLHWHGMHLPARMDGGPHQTVQPRRTLSPAWRIDQPAATLWYHPHPHSATARHVYRGLAGLFFVDDAAGAPAGVPGRYGVDDVPLVVQDKRFRDGELDESLPMIPSTGILGDTISVNGVVAPFLEVGAERVRLRLLNASNARVYNFGFSDGRAFEQIGTDGGLLPRPYRTTRVQLSPGERAEVVVAFRPADRVVLRSFPPDLGANAWDRRFAGGDDVLDILQIRAAATLSPSQGRLPDVLDAGPRQTPPITVTRRFELAGTQINGARMDMRRIDFAATAGSTELWEVVNSDGKPHNFHVHHVQFRVVAIDGAPPAAPLAGRKDTVYLPPKRVYRLALTFTDHTDDTVPYMFHCHLLWHEDLGMMGQFVVVEAGRTAAPASAGGHPHHHE